uniref:BPTI/Kunitz inhibitor domain-containing protein n=1 Tax=Mesocestoides corti TaxID=53468 RepID=A0A5K3F663_MESCO
MITVLALVAICLASFTEARQSYCLQEPDPGPCRGFFQRWYFDAVTNECSRFMYSGCMGNENNFDSKEECESECMH